VLSQFIPTKKIAQAAHCILRSDLNSAREGHQSNPQAMQKKSQYVERLSEDLLSGMLHFLNAPSSTPTISH
jgi:hypothetical protein